MTNDGQGQSTPESSAGQASAVEGQIPEAVLAASGPRRVQVATRLWWLTILCFVVAVVLTTANFRGQGLAISVAFPDGHGLKVGDALRYRGITVGEVTAIALAGDLQSVSAKIVLETGNEALAVEGSQFWIQRPQLQLGQVDGLDTVLGAKYVGLLPGDPAGKQRIEFTGLATPLSITEGAWREVEIEFPSGEGLEVGNPVLYRGISVGEVLSVNLSTDGASVLVKAGLMGGAQKLATAGTQFWIERPRLDITEVRGLDTLVTGRYIAMQPASSSSAQQDFFVGLPAAPPLPRRDGSLEVELDAPRRLGLVRGAPVTYRGLEVGRVSNVELSPDGASVKVGVIIEREYTELVRADSRWWANGGVELEAGLKGVNVSVESLTAWIRGGVAFATPPDHAEAVVTGHRFMLQPEPVSAWLDWQPRIAIGSRSAAANGIALPKPIRVAASWRASILGLYRRHTTETWALAMDDGSLRVPSTFVDDLMASGAAVTIETQGKTFEFSPIQRGPGLRVESIKFPASIAAQRFSVKNISDAYSDKSVFLVVNPELSQPMALDTTRISVAPETGFRVAPGIPLSKELLGSPVVESSTGNLYGLLIESSDGWYIARAR